MMRAGLLALAAVCAPAAMAQTPSSQVAVYVDMDLARQLVLAQSPPPPDTTGADRAQLATLEADYKTRTNTLQRTAPTLSPQQLRIAQSDLKTLEDRIRRLTSTINDTLSLRVTDMNYAADTKILRAIDDYRKENPLGVIQRHGSGAGEDMVIVPGGVFEIADSLAEMVKSGPGALAPAHPGRAPVVKYVDALSFYQGMNIEAAIRAEADRRNVELDASRRELRDMGAKLDQLQRFGAADVKDEHIRYLQKQIALDARVRESDTQLQTMAKYQRQGARELAAQWLARNPTILGADVIRFLTAEDNLLAGDKSLNVTDALVAAVKPKP